jgi:signal transduction histidine kinase
MSQADIAPRRASRPLRPGGWTPLDLGLALSCLALLSVEVLPNEDMSPRGWLMAGLVVISLPIAWRRAWPGPVAAVALAGFFLTSLVTTGPFPPQLPLIPVLLLVFHAALRLRARASLGWGLATLTLLVSAHVASPDGDLADFWPWMLWAGAWGAGTMARRHSDEAARHTTHAALLEAQASMSATESAERERDRIARELHDVVGHAVSVMVVQAGAERLRLGADAGPTGQVLSAIEGSGRQALAELRTMLGVLREAESEADGLLPLPGLADVPALVDRLRSTGLDVRLVVEPPEVVTPSAQLPSAVELAAYRIVQESLTNVVRHAGLVQTLIELRRTDGSLTVEVRNASSDQPALNGHAEGRGLAGMRERAAAVGGHVTAHPTDHGGFLVSAVLPSSPTSTAGRPA